MRLQLRAYVPELNKTVDVMGYHPVNNSVYLSTVHLFGTESDDVLMYCGDEPDQVKLRIGTGLKDKNGVEIYEGDIVRAGTVESKDGAVRDMNVPVEYVRGIFEPIAYVTDDVLEVIGNIYENPELLGSRDGDE